MSAAPVRFKPPVWLGIYTGVVALTQLGLAPSRWPVAHVTVAVIAAVATVRHFTASYTQIDDDGISVPGVRRRVRHRWDDVTFLGLRRRGDRQLTIVLTDGRRRPLPNVPASAYPAIRDRFPVVSSLESSAR